MSDHFNLVNKSTMYGNYNTGKVIDESRYNSMQKVPEQFAKSGKIGYNYNFAANQLQQVGYTYGNK